MSKQHRTAGVDYKEVEINGKIYKLRPLKLGIYASMESYIASMRPDPLQIASEAVKKLPTSQHAAIWQAAMAEATQSQMVTAEQSEAFENSVHGLSWKLWQCLHQDHPEINSVQAATDLLLEAGEEHFERLARSVEIASGESDLKKSSGQGAEERTETAQAGQ